MPRIARFTYDNAYYHIMTRGNNKQDIFLSNNDYLEYKGLLAHYKNKYKLSIFHYVLMTNHVHLIVQSPTGKNLSNMMKGLNLTYALYFRKKYGGIGHFWQDRFKSFIIEDGIYLLECGRYIELNPVAAGIIKYPWEYLWSSCNYYVSGNKDELIDINPEYYNFSKDVKERRSIYKKFLLDGIKDKERRNEYRFFKTGVYGSKEFIEKMKKSGLKTVWSHSGRPKKNKDTK